jgi:glycosyltransferase involved in cell wall biosynthesis
MNNKILLSICIPTYNRAEYLKRCITSIISQDNFNSNEVEVLISDNASPDNTEQVVKLFQDKFSNIKYIKNEVNVGLERNILNLLKSFNGEYCFILTDDDMLLPNSLTKLTQIITYNSECSVFLSSLEVFVEPQKRTYIDYTFPVSKKIYKNDIKEIVKFFNASNVASRICIRRDFIDTEGYIRHMQSMYSLMYLVGYAALNGISFYMHDPLVWHTRDNKTFWDYPNDYMLNGILNLIKDLNKFNNKFYPLALDYLISNWIPYSILDAILKRPKKLLKLIFEIYKIPEIGFNLKIWIKIVYNFLRILSNIAIRKLRRSIKL